MNHRQFDNYLTLLSSLLKLGKKQRHIIAVELRDHLEERVAELTARGISEDDAISQALADFGDAASLASTLSQIARVRRRKVMMKITASSLLAMAAIVALAFFLAPDPQGPVVPKQVVAQVPEVPAETAEPSSGRVEAAILVRMQRPGISEEPVPADFNPQEFAIYKATQAALIRSYPVLSQALERKDIHEIVEPLADGHPSAWLAEHLEVAFPDEAMLMVVSLAAGDPAEMQAVLDAVVEQYMDVCFRFDERRHLDRLDVFRNKAGELENDIRRHEANLMALKSQLGQDATQSVDVAVLQGELEMKWRLYASLTQRIQELELEAQASPRIQWVQSARIVDGP